MYHKSGSTVNTPGQISAASAVYGIRFKNFSNFGEKFNLSIKIAGITLGMKVTSAQRIMSKCEKCGKEFPAVTYAVSSLTEGMVSDVIANDNHTVSVYALLRRFIA